MLFKEITAAYSVNHTKLIFSVLPFKNESRLVTSPFPIHNSLSLSPLHPTLYVPNR